METLTQAEELIQSAGERHRDKGRHLLMDSASTEEEWSALAFRFTTLEFFDLRGGVVDRFLATAPLQARDEFARAIVERCKRHLRDLSTKEEIYGEGLVRMQWMLNALVTLGDREESLVGLSFLRSRFGERLPTPIKHRIHYFPLPLGT